MHHRNNNKTKKQEPERELDCIGFARYHSIMILLLVIFFGILIVPFCLRQIERSYDKKIDGKIVEIFYCNKKPAICLVKIEYLLDGKETYLTETVYQYLKKNDGVILYLNEKTGTISFRNPPSFLVHLIFLISYFLIVLLCLYLIIDFFLLRKNC